jgi:type I restriction-modification system DNA methylase subunit
MPTVTENLQNITPELLNHALFAEKYAEINLRIAEALDWTTDSAWISTNQFRLNSTVISKGFIGPQPAALFSVETNGNHSINDAALYAYHASIPWGLVASSERLIIFNSHWIRQNNWFHLPPIQWTDLARNSEILEALTPKGIEEGRIDKIATKSYKPDRFLRPVDDALVERLDYWRSETLRYSKQVKNVDEALQTLFAQLFILRTVEDRRLALNLPSLSSVCNASGEVTIDALREILYRAQETIGGELYNIDTLEFIPQNVLGGIINDLYTPFNLPGESRYNFAWIDADILGLAYEKYLSTIFTPKSPSPQLSLFNQPEREVETKSVRKSGGVYYTPPYLVQFLTESCINKHFSLDNNKIPRIADFACGSGSFLVAAANSLIKRLRVINPEINWARELVQNKYIIGIDVDERAVTMTRLHLWLRFAEEPNPLPLPSLQEIIIHGDSLSDEVWTKIPSDYDVVLGNPPFLATGRTPSRDELAKKFKTAQGRYDYSYLFVELAVKHLQFNGTLGMVIPNRLFRNRDASTIREILTDETNLLLIVDFGSNEVFEKTSAYIGSIVAQKVEPNEENFAKLTRVINVESISSDFLAAMLINATLSEDEINNEDLKAFDVPHPRGNSPWLLVAPSIRRSRTKLEDQSEQLGSIAGIYQGIRTGANDIFIVQIESGDSFLAKIVNGLGDYGYVETEILHPVVFGSDIQKYDVVNSNRYIIYPYRHNRAISEGEIEDKYPRTYEYLSRYRDILASRGSINAGGLQWYELVRKRDEAWLKSPKLLIRDLATETSFAIDPTGTTFLVGGTAVVPADSDLLLPLLGYLNSSMVNEYIRQITPEFKGGFQKFEPQHLQKIRVLTKFLTDFDVNNEIGKLAEEVIKAKFVDNEVIKLRAEKAIEQILIEASQEHD